MMKSGIYGIWHKSSGRMYVGSSCDVERRWRQHLHHLRRGSHANGKLQNAWNKHGETAFEFVLLEQVYGDLVAREQWYIDAIRPHFNISTVAGRERAGTKHTPEAIARMVAAHQGKVLTDEHRQKLSVAFKGRQFSEETRRKISEAKTGKKRAPFSPQARANMAASAVVRWANRS